MTFKKKIRMPFSIFPTILENAYFLKKKHTHKIKVVPDN